MSILRTRTSFLNLREKDVIRCQLAHPEWTAQEIAQASGANAAAVSIALRHKLDGHSQKVMVPVPNYYLISRSGLKLGTSKAICHWLR